MKLYQELKTEDPPPPVKENIQYEFAWWHVPVFLVLWYVGGWFREFVYKKKRKW